MKKTTKKTINRCYLCDRNAPVYYFNKLGYSIYRCPSCNLLSLDFREDQKGYFTGNKKIRAYANYAEDKPNIARNARNILEKIKQFKSHGNVLDVGCAMGFFMEEAEKYGYRSYGIEVSNYAARLAKKLFSEGIFLPHPNIFISFQKQLFYRSYLKLDIR